MKFSILFIILSALILKLYSQATVKSWITRADQTQLLESQPEKSWAQQSAAAAIEFAVDDKQLFQSVDGFGFSLTGGSAYHIYRLPVKERKKLLQELFGSGPQSIGISYLRISIGASDLDENVFSYDDLPPGQSDEALSHFTLKSDSAALLPLLKEILSIRPQLRIMGSPWSAPVWMKNNGKSKGGSLLPKYYDAYARYFVKYIQEMKSNGIRIDAVTPQNEPLHPGNNPSMFMSAEVQAEFIKYHLGPAFRAAGIDTRIVVYDHNCNRPDYPISILNDPEAKQYVEGSAFHLYEGDISAMSAVHDAHPDRQLYFTEQWTGAKGSFREDLLWHEKNVIIGSMRNWSRIALEWNLANDARFEPHTPGGCTECKGALTIDASIVRNVSYYIVAHASRFIPPGSVRIQSNWSDELPNVAFITPSGEKVMIVLNEQKHVTPFTIVSNGRRIALEQPAESVVTYIW
jgi:glucosylceramidase